MPVLLYWGFQLAAFLARVVPLRVSYGCARGAGTLAYYVWGGGRRRCTQNMRHVTGGDERAARRYARASFANYVVYLVDFFRFMRTDSEEIRARVRFDRWAEIEAGRTGNGIIFVTMHFGNWDVGAARLAIQDFPVSAIADTFPNHRVNRLVLDSRRHLGMNVIPAERMGPGILRALRNNDVVAVLIDVPTPGGVEVEFFGDTIAVSDGPARIALRAGSTVYAATMPRLSPWSELIGADLAPVPFEQTGDRETDVRRLTQAVFTQLEEFVLRDPSQWYIFRNLWLSDLPQRPA